MELPKTTRDSRTGKKAISLPTKALTESEKNLLQEDLRQATATMQKRWGKFQTTSGFTRNQMSLP
jgi:hypothetical protein